MLFRICVVEGIKIQKHCFGLEMILHKPEDLGYVFVCLPKIRGKGNVEKWEWGKKGGKKGDGRF